MKNSILKSALTFLALVLFSACSSSSDDNNGGGNPNPTPTTENSWSLNAYKFSRRVSSQELATTIGGKTYTLVIVDSNIAATNNNFKTCQTVFNFNTHLAGVYTVKSKNTVVASDLNYIYFECTVYDLAGKGAKYESSDSSVTTTVTKVNGKLIATAPNDIILTKTVNDGLENAPATIIFKCDRVQ